ncbi:MAG: fibronectin type III domain-containing protein [Acidobacteria bacterium]|nr:fibronectin type III domain-containing protein [Acidobacteriota bacterium]
MNRAGYPLLRGAKRTTNLFNNSFGILTAAAVLLTAVFGALLTGRTADAANPATATLSPTSTQVAWQGSAIGGGALNAPLTIGGEDLCEEGLTCDTFTLTIAGTPADWAAAKKIVHVHLGWALPTTDYDLYIHKDNLSGEIVATSGQGATNPTGPLTSEDADLDPTNPSVGTGTFAVHVVYYSATAADQYSGTASVVDAPVATPTPTPSGTPVPVSGAPAPRFFNYPDPFSHRGGEPSIGVNWKTGNVMFIASLRTLRIQFDDNTSPASANWADKSFTTTSTVSLDPILFTDPRPFAQGLSGAGYPNAVYYASQDIATAEVALSVDGGRTFGPAVPMYALTQCGGLHGHIKVAPDGTVYVPNRSCGGKQGFAVSKDNGLTWEVKLAPNSSAGEWDPSLGVGADGTVYFGYGDGVGSRTPRMVVYDPKTDTWSNDQAVGGATTFNGVAFPAVVAGDGDRAAFAFLGTTSAGNPFGTGLSFTGVWHLYVATTYDRGASYTFTDATPGDPVQRGNICDSGTTCPDTPRDTRNLLDFMDAQLDQKGRVLVGYADGCVTAACVAGQDVSGSTGKPDGAVNSYDNDGTALATIARQSGGKSLFSRFDAEFALNTPAAPQVIASSDGQANHVTWSTPDDGGSPITGYRIYRGAEGSAESLVASVGIDSNSYADAGAPLTNYYRVSALNANGEGAKSPKTFPAELESACKGAGITVLKDPGGDSLDQLPSHDIKSVRVAEPYFADGSNKLVFTLTMANLSGPLTPNTQWRIYFTGPDAKGYFVDMRTDALGAASYKYGTYVHNADNTQGAATTVGDADAGSRYDAQTGAITIVVSNAKIGAPKADDKLSRIFVRIPVVAVVPDNANYSSPSAAVAYTLVGNAACQQPPAAPSNLTASSPAKSVVTLNWADNSDETGFSVERSTQIDTGFAEVATVGQNTISYTDRSVGRRVTYYYRVRAVRGTAKSSYSNTAAARSK